MNKKTPSLAMELLKEQKRRTTLWAVAFAVAFAVVIIDRLAGKGGR